MSIPRFLAFVPFVFGATMVAQGQVTTPLPAENVAVDGKPLEQFLQDKLALADKMTQRSESRNARPSDARFQNLVMRKVTSAVPRQNRDERLPLLIKLLSHDDARVRYVAVTAINVDWGASNGFPSPHLKKFPEISAGAIRLLSDELWESAEAAAVHLAVHNKKGWPMELERHMCAQFESGDVAATRRAARLIAATEAPPASIEASLRGAFRRHPTGELDFDLMLAMLRYQKIPKEAVPGFVNAVCIYVPDTSGSAMMGGRIFVPKFGDPQAEKTRNTALAALKFLGPDSVSAIPLFIERLKDSDITVRARAATALGHFGPLAKEALPHLLAMQTVEAREVYVGPNLFWGGGMRRFEKRIDDQVQQAYQRISGLPAPWLLRTFGHDALRQLGAVLITWDHRLAGLDAQYPGLKVAIRQLSEFPQLKVAGAVVMALAERMTMPR